MRHPRGHIPFFILALAVTLVAASMYAYMFYATSASLRQANLARDIVVLEGANQSQAKSLSALAETTAYQRAEIPSFFISSDNVVAFIKALESIGPQSGSEVTLASVDADSLSKSSPGTMGLARAHVSAVGSWASVMRALSLAERMPYAVSIDRVSLSGSGTAKHVWSLSFDIQAALIVASSGT